MNIVIISANSRKESQSLKIAKWFAQQALVDGCDVELIDLHASQLPLELDKLWGKDPATMQIWNPIQQALERADGFVIVSPEWSGMASPSFFNLMEYIGTELAYKPALLVAVSASQGGAYPIAQVRGFASKNTHIDFIPEHIIVRDVENVFNNPEPDDKSKSDVYLQKRSQYALKLLYEYANALKSLRATGVIDNESYPNGM